MTDVHWFTVTASGLLRVLFSGIGIYLSLLVCTRLAGVRSFSDLSSFDFAVTVAIGSLIGATLLQRDTPVVQGVVGLLVLFGLQYGVSTLRRRSPRAANLIDNEPVLIMAGAEILDENLERVRMTEADLRSKLRAEGITRREQVLAVIVERTGDVSVLRADEEPSELDFELIADVRGAERLK